MEDKGGHKGECQVHKGKGCSRSQGLQQVFVTHEKERSHGTLFAKIESQPIRNHRQPTQCATITNMKTSCDAKHVMMVRAVISARAKHGGRTNLRGEGQRGIAREARDGVHGHSLCVP
jgi:hypothetical protein